MWTCSPVTLYEFAETNTADEVVAGLDADWTTGALGGIPYVFDFVECSPAADAFVVFFGYASWSREIVVGQLGG
jgi:hypothetical protein